MWYILLVPWFHDGYTMMTYNMVILKGIPGKCPYFTIVCCFFVSSSCCLCFQFLWIVHFWLLLRYSLTLISLINAGYLITFKDIMCSNNNRVKPKTVKTVSPLRTH
jgi:hypothetical protein